MPALSTLAAIGALGSAGASAGSMIQGNANRKEYEAQAAENRRRSREAQLAALGQSRRPEMSSAYSDRIKALTAESKPTSLVEDPYFQKQRSNIVQGGQKALSRVENTQAATGATGGFSNQGSIADVLDRVSGSLAGLGQDSANLKSQKSDQAAKMEQEFLDAQIAYDNAQARARAAIEAGDAEAANQAINAAVEADARAKAAQTAVFGGLAGGLADVFGPAWLKREGVTAADRAGAGGGGAGAARPGVASQRMAALDLGGGYGAPMPSWAAIRRRSSA